MTWVRPQKWYGGESPSAAKWNQEVRDNMNAHGKDKPYFSGTAKASNNVLTGVALSLTLDTVVDPYTMKSPTFQNRISAPAGWPGLYFVSAGVSFSANATGKRRIEIKTSRQAAPYDTVASTSSDNTYALQQHWMSVCGFALLNGAGNYLTLEAWQNSGSTLTVGNYLTFNVMYVGENEYA